MRLLPTRRSLPWWLLVISIAFNLGFGATYGARTYGPVGAGAGRTVGCNRCRDLCRNTRPGCNRNRFPG